MQLKRFDLQAAALTLFPLLALLLNFLNFNNYPFLKWDSLIVIASLLAPTLMTLGFGVLWRPAAYLIPAFCVAAYLDTLAPIMQRMELQGWSQTLLYSAIVLLLSLLLYRIRAKAQNVLVVVFTVIILGNAAGALFAQHSSPFERNDPQPGFHANASLPLYIHLILDAHIGVDGLPPEVPESAVARDTMTRFFERWGFRVFPAAFSHYNETEQSLPNLVGFSEVDSTFPGGIIKRNRLFESLKARGYRLHVYETDFLRFCQPEGVHVDYCYTYNPNGLNGLNSVAMPPTRKALVIADHWLGTINFVQVAKNKLNYVLQRLIGRPLISIEYDRSGPSNSMAALERLMQDVRASPTGTAFFAHLLIPHEPYVYNADCTPSGDPRYWSSQFDYPLGELSDSNRIERYGLYLPQLRCIYRILDGWMAKLNQAGMLDRATIVLHGDHGSRISTYPLPHKDLEARLLRDQFSALFAVHSPGITPGSDPVVKPINRLARELMESPDQMSRAEPDGLFLLMHREFPEFYDPKEILEHYAIAPELFAPSATR